MVARIPREPERGPKPFYWDSNLAQHSFMALLLISESEQMLKLLISHNHYK